MWVAVSSLDFEHVVKLSSPKSTYPTISPVAEQYAISSEKEMRVMKCYSYLVHDCVEALLSYVETRGEPNLTHHF